jgi:penicillin-binding protein 1A
MCSFAFGMMKAVASEIPSLDPQNRHEVLNGYVYANDGKTVLAVLRGDENRVLVKWNEISPRMVQAIVAVEDRRFWEHNGIDVRGIARALWADIRHKGVVEGGSTITQQFVKNAYIKNEKTIGRKVREAALAYQLSQQWSKQRILTAYLNTIYFGNGAYGVQQAAKIYFGKSARDLTLPEAALLAGLPASPTAFDPVSRPAAARARRAKALAAMRDVGYISAREYRNALKAPLPKPDDVHLPGTQTPWAPYFTDYVKQELIDHFGYNKVFGGGLRVKTTIDLGLQDRARQAVAKWLHRPDGPEAALVAIDPTDGNVLAMVGGRSYRESQFNLAVQGERQPGSSFKPFVLASALQQGISPSTRFESKPKSIWVDNKYWYVSNYEDTYLGLIDLESATINSDNSVYADLTALVGPKTVAKTAKRLGVRSPLRSYFSIGIGGESVNPLEMARAYSAFANGGYRIDTRTFGNRPRAIEEITNAKGRVVDDGGQTSKQVLSRRSAAMVNTLLQEVIQQGTGRRAALPGFPAAGKTGTTDNYGDAWFVGYTPKLVVAVWVGYRNELRPMMTEFDGDPVAGGTYPALIWKSFMVKALPYLGLEPDRFEAPSGTYAVPETVVQRNGTFQRDNGYCRGTRQVSFFVDLIPSRTADCLPNEVDVPRVVGWSLPEAMRRLALQPLTPTVLYAPATAGQRVGVVLKQIPAGGGHLSAHDKVTLVLGRPVHGIVPNLRGTMLDDARKRLSKRKLRLQISQTVDGPDGRVMSQTPAGGVAAAPGMTVKLVVAHGSGSGTHARQIAKVARRPG